MKPRTRSAKSLGDNCHGFIKGYRITTSQQIGIVNRPRMCCTQNCTIKKIINIKV